MSDLNSLQQNHIREREVVNSEALRLATARDDLTARYLFALATLNAASIIALITITSSSTLFQTAPDYAVWLVLACFAIGVVLAGFGIQAHRNSLIERSGYAAALSTTLNTLVTLSGNQRGDDGSYARAAKTRDGLQKEVITHSRIALVLERLAGSLWLTGTGTLAISTLRGF